MFLEILGDYSEVWLKSFQRIEQKLENAFLANFSFFENFVTSNKKLWNFTSSINPAVSIKVFENNS